MRLDVVMRAPADGGDGAARRLFRAGARAARALPFGEARPRRAGAFDPAPLRAGRIPEPDLDGAERMPFAFSATATAAAIAAQPSAADGLFLDRSLHRRRRPSGRSTSSVWPAGDHSRIPAAARRRCSAAAAIVFELAEPHAAPCIRSTSTATASRCSRSNKRDLPVHHADTVLLQPKERVEVAFVADNPGDWMLHCHIIEHQETGMMGYIRVA